jgi:hypothetical protein
LERGDAGDPIIVRGHWTWTHHPLLSLSSSSLPLFLLPSPPPLPSPSHPYLLFPLLIDFSPLLDFLILLSLLARDSFCLGSSAAQFTIPPATSIDPFSIRRAVALSPLTPLAPLVRLVVLFDAPRTPSSVSQRLGDPSDAEILIFWWIVTQISDDNDASEPVCLPVPRKTDN